MNDLIVNRANTLVTGKINGSTGFKLKSLILKIYNTREILCFIFYHENFAVTVGASHEFKPFKWGHPWCNIIIRFPFSMDNCQSWGHC